MKKLFCLIVALTSFSHLAYAGTALDAKKKQMKVYEEKRLKAQDYQHLMMEAVQHQKWDQVIVNAKALRHFYPGSPFVPEAIFQQGIAYFNLGENEFANANFTDYLKQSSNLKNFEEAVNYKFQIANAFEAGSKKRLFGLKKMPKLLPAKDEAMKIYDEVIAALPRSDLAAQSLFKKAGLLVVFEDFKESIELYQTLIRRFPKHPLASQSFIAIADVYLKECTTQYPDPTLIELAEINLRRFEVEHPSEPMIEKASEMLLLMKTKFAEELFNIGHYFERKKKVQSAMIYYKSILLKYPDTKYGDLALKRVQYMQHKAGTDLDFDLAIQ